MDMSVSTGRMLSSRGRVALQAEWVINAWLELLPPRQAGPLSVLHRAVLAASPVLLPCVRWGNLVYLREGRAVAQLTPCRRATQLHLVQWRTRQRPARYGPAENMRRFLHSQEIDAVAVTRLVVEALRMQRP
jgi:hypothetical protein